MLRKIWAVLMFIFGAMALWHAYDEAFRLGEWNKATFMLVLGCFTLQSVGAWLREGK